MRKGFITVIVVLAIFLVTIIMLNISYQQTETISFKEELLNEKMMLTNYELTMNRAVEGRDFTEATLDGNSNAILAIIQPAFTNCDTIINTATLTPSSASITIECTTNIAISSEQVFWNTYSKIITVES